MSWQLLLAISIFATSFWTLLQRILAKKEASDPIAYAIVFQIITGFLIGIYAVFHGFQMVNVRAILPNFLLMLIFFSSANILAFNALKRIEASEYTVLFATRAFWTILAAVIFLHETFATKEVLGTALIITSIFLVSWKSHKIRLTKGEIFALLAAMAFGLTIANDSYIVRTNDVASYLSIAFILPALITWFIFPSSTKHMKVFFEKKTFFSIFLMALLATISAISYLSAYQIGKNAAQLASINQTSTVLTVVLAVLLLGERRELLKKILAAIISFFGVILITT